MTSEESSKTMGKEGIGLSKIFLNVRYEHLLAGVSGGVVSTVILHPLDLVKVRFQVDEGVHGPTIRPQYQGMFHAFRAICRTDGFLGLYQGVTPNVLGAGAAWGSYFCIYNALKSWMQAGDTKTPLGPAKHMSAAAISGVITLALTNPFWVAKTRMCLQYDKSAAVSQASYKGLIDCLGKIYKAEGIPGFYRGFLPGIVGVSHGALQFMAYEELKRMYNNYKGRPLDHKFNTFEYLTFAAISKIFAASATYPYQVVRSRLQDQHRTYGGLIDVIKQIWRFEGLRGLYKGFTLYLLHVVPNIAIVFIIYEEVVNVCDTGSDSDNIEASIELAGTSLDQTDL